MALKVLHTNHCPTTYTDITLVLQLIHCTMLRESPHLCSKVLHHLLGPGQQRGSQYATGYPLKVSQRPQLMQTPLAKIPNLHCVVNGQLNNGGKSAIDEIF